MILNITAKGLTFRIIEKNLEIKTPARLRFNENAILIIMSELRRQNIHSWYITSDQNTPLRSTPKTAINKFGKLNKPIKIEKDKKSDCLVCQNKLDILIEMVESLSKKQFVSNIQPSQKTNVEHQFFTSQKDEFIPTIDISNMEISTSGQKIVDNEQDVDLHKLAAELKNVTGGNDDN